MKVGIIGCGKIAQVRHIPEYLDNNAVTIEGYYDYDYDRASELAKVHGGKAYKSLDKMLDEKDIDAVSVCVANNAHADITIQALKAGKHVLCEKPMATNIEDCRKMVEAAKSNSKFLMIGQNQRFVGTHIRARELIKAGEIGKALTFKTTFGHGGPENWSIDKGKNNWFFDKKKASMGAMADLGVHKTDLIRFLLDDDIVEVTGKLVTLDKRNSEGELIDLDDNALCIYQMSSGVIGTMTSSWTYYAHEDNSTIIYGTKGIMKIFGNPAYSIEVDKKVGEEDFYKVDKIQTNDNQTKSGIIDEFVDALTHNRKPSVSGETVLNTMEAVFAAIDSSNEGRTVKI
ncbi:MAG: Gfo/Idh/MocA family protein [Suipraeoptans sp.]